METIYLSVKSLAYLIVGLLLVIIGVGSNISFEIEGTIVFIIGVCFLSALVYRITKLEIANERLLNSKKVK